MLLMRGKIMDCSIIMMIFYGCGLFLIKIGQVVNIGPGLKRGNGV